MDDCNIVTMFTDLDVYCLFVYGANDTVSSSH